MAGVAMIYAAGGVSRRFGQDKLFVSFEGEPLFLAGLRTLLPLADVCIVVTGHRQEMEYAIRDAGLSFGKIAFAPAGESRQKSVENGLSLVPDWISIVAVQDAARPYTSVALFRQCVESAGLFGSGVAAHRVVDTIKVVDSDGLVRETPDRTLLWAAETPQVFRKEWLLKGYAFCREKGVQVTDDAEAVQRAGFPVRLVENREKNLKITLPADLNYPSYSEPVREF